MKLISIWEPWSTLVAIGAKLNETRSWSTQYRGWLAIQASATGLSKREMWDTLDDPFFREALGITTLPPMQSATPKFHLGCILAVVKLVDCVSTERIAASLSDREFAFGDYAAGRYAWVTSNRFRLPEPIPYKAHQGLCEVDAQTVNAIREQFRRPKER